MNRSDSGYILAATIVTITLLAFAALLTGRTFGVLLRSSVQERLVIEERFAARNAEKIIDAWMADPALSKEITDQKAGYDAWRNPEGAATCPTAGYSTCWRVTVTDPHSDPTNRPKLRGEEAVQELRDITTEIRSGCYSGIDRCQRTRTSIRTYERNVFAQYQLHYASHVVPPIAAHGPNKMQDPAGCFASPPPEPPPDPALCDGLNPNALVVFADGDAFNGPVRHSDTGGIRYCLSGSNTLLFKRLEIKSEPGPSETQNLCGTTQPQWCDDPCTTALSEPWSPNSRHVIKGDDLQLPPWGVPDPDDRTDLTCNPCNTSHFNPTEDVFYRKDDFNLGTVDFTPSQRSVTIISEANIRVTGNIMTTGLNDADGPNVIALIAQENIILDHTPGTQIVFSRVALLARNGGVFASGWKSPCVNAFCPTFKLEGSAAMKHLGLYGQVGPPQTGWIKKFKYPENFWRARPPWWPGFEPKEWRPLH